MIPPSPFCVTTTPNCFKLAFPYHPRLVELVKRIPSVKQNIRAAYIADEKAWKVSLQDKEYVRMMADWAVQTRICSRVQHKVTTREYNDYTIPDLPKLTVPHELLLEPYEYQKETVPAGFIAIIQNHGIFSGKFLKFTLPVYFQCGRTNDKARIRFCYRNRAYCL